METNKAGFEIQTCSRCGGSGSYSFNLMTGSRCFKCHGGKVVLTARGSAAKAHYMSLLQKPVSEIQVGDSVLTNLGMSATKKWFRVASIKPDTLNKGCIALELTRPSKQYDHGYTIHQDAQLPSVKTEAERVERLAEALAYQDTLTKTGKVAKKHEKLAA